MSVPDEDVMRLDVEGSVYHHLPEDKAAEWRSDIRKLAREMNWRIQTGYNRESHMVWAARTDFQAQIPELEGQAIADALDRRWRRAQGEGPDATND